LAGKTEELLEKPAPVPLCNVLIAHAIRFKIQIFFSALCFQTLVILICKSGFLDFVHHLYFNKITTFRKLKLLPSSDKKGRTETLAVGPPA
jgi:hypothetical protein